ncbi:hypothetical protein ABTM72_19895, partial [Acinetobacter baumannii]
GLTLLELRKDFLFWPFAMLFSLVYFNVGFMAISEFNLCFALTACALACMMRYSRPKPFDRVLLMTVALIYPFEYASTLFLGPIL